MNKKLLKIFILFSVLCIALCSCGDKKEASIDDIKQQESETSSSAFSMPDIDVLLASDSDFPDEPPVDPVSPPQPQAFEPVIPDQSGGDPAEAAISDKAVLMAGISPDELRWNEEGTQILGPIPIEYEFVDAPEGYFDDALFIGDSRTVGLQHYGKFEGPLWFADTGLSVYNYTKREVDVKGFGKTKFDNLLKNGRYSKVYIGLGINEVGYDLSQTAHKFRDLIADIRDAHPDCTIYLMANLHVTEERHLSDKVVNNNHINTLNTMLYNIALYEDNIYYIDATPLFDDENGNMNSELTFDNTHLLGKHYATWVDFIKTHVIQ